MTANDPQQQPMKVQIVATKTHIDPVHPEAGMTLRERQIGANAREHALTIQAQAYLDALAAQRQQAVVLSAAEHDRDTLVALYHLINDPNLPAGVRGALKEQVDQLASLNATTTVKRVGTTLRSLAQEANRPLEPSSEPTPAEQKPAPKSVWGFGRVNF